MWVCVLITRNSGSQREDLSGEKRARENQTAAVAVAVAERQLTLIHETPIANSVREYSSE